MKPIGDQQMAVFLSLEELTSIVQSYINELTPGIIKEASLLVESNSSIFTDEMKFGLLDNVRRRLELSYPELSENRRFILK